MTVFDSFAAAGAAHEKDVTRLRRIAESYAADPDDAVRDAMVLAQTATDLFKAGIAVLDEFCSLGTKDWDRIDRQRVMIQRSAVTRARPCMLAGWRCVVQFQVLLPEYISPALLNETMQAAGRLQGVGDFRPSYGRFQVVGFRAE